MKYFLIKCNKALPGDKFLMKETDGFFVLAAFGLKELRQTCLATLAKGYGMPKEATLSKHLKYTNQEVEKRSLFGIPMISVRRISEKPTILKEFTHHHKVRNKTYNLKLVENSIWKNLELCQ